MLGTRLTRLLTALLLVAAAATASAQQDGQMTFVYFSYQKVAVGEGDVSALVPMLARDSRGFAPADFQKRVFSLLQASKPDIYGMTSIYVNPDRSVTVNLDGSRKAYFPIIVGEVVFSLTEQGATQVSFPAIRPEPFSRNDVDLPAFTFVTPLWRVLPPQPIPFGLVRLDDGSLVPSTEVHAWIEGRAPRIAEATLRYLQSDDPARVLAAVASMKELGLPNQTEHFLRLVGHPGLQVRQMVVETLSTSTDDAVLQALADRMTREPDTALVSRIAGLLSHSGKARFASYGLFHDLTSGDPARAAAAAEKLGEMQDRKAVPELAKAAASPDQKLRITAVKAIARIGDDRQLKDLIAHPEILPDAKVEAALALSSAADRDMAQNGLVFLLLNTPGEHSARAAQSLAASRDPRVVPWLIQALKHQNPATRQAASEGLGTLGDPRALGPLAEAARLPPPEGALHAQQTLRVMAAQSVESVLRLSGDANESIRRLATESLGHHVARTPRLSRQVLPVLLQRAEDASPDVRLAAVRALGMTGDAQALPAILKAAGDAVAPVRAAAAQALGHYSPPAGSAEVLRLIEDVEDAVRLEAIQACRTRKEEGAVELLVNYSRHGNKDIRSSVMWALAEINPVKLHNSLREVFSEAVFDQDPKVRLAAIQGLKVIKDPRVLDIMSVLLQDPDREVQCSAIRAYGETGYPQAFEPLKSALANSDTGVKMCAIDGLVALQMKDAIPLLQPIASDDLDKALQAKAKDAIVVLQKVR